MWTCQCGRQNPGNAPCECKVVKIEKKTDDRNISGHKFCPVPRPTYHTTSEEKHAFYERKRLMAEARKSTDALLSDPSFDISISASRGRLEKALAIASEIALRRVENGMAIEGDGDLVMKVASMYRTLANTVEAKDPSQMSEEELRKQANK